jgi:ribosomal protein L11 methyltransferase (prmA)
MAEKGHEFLARIGKTRLRPGGVVATDWLLEKGNIKADSKVLEVACNMGTTLIHIAKKYGCDIIGVDLDEKAVEKAKKKVKDNDLEDKVKVMEGDAFKLSFEDESFDVVVNEAMLTMLLGDKKEKALKEYYRVLKPGGVVLIQDVVLITDDENRARELRIGLSRAINVNVEPLIETEWKACFERSGFQVEEKSGPMSLMSIPGMMKDEGILGAFSIIRTGLQEFNKEYFQRMRSFMMDNKKELGYICFAGRKE